MNKPINYPQFSVLMSIYHKEDPIHFQAAMESIWDNQTNKPNEIILVEDGPLSPSLDKVISHWQSKLPSVLKVIVLKENLGTGKAKNIGLNYCNYPYVAVMDTDDLCIPTRFETQLNFLMHNPDVVLVGGHIIEFENTIDNVLSEKKVPLTDAEIKAYASKRSPFNHPTTMYRRDVILTLGGYQHHLLMEDYNLWIRILSSAHQTANIDQVLVFMRSRKAMLGRRRGLRYIKSEWQMMRLKKTLNFQGYKKSIPIFVARSLPRLLPSFLLGIVYKLLRN